MQFVSLGDNLHEMLIPYFLEKKFHVLLHLLDAKLLFHGYIQ